MNDSDNIESTQEEEEQFKALERQGPEPISSVFGFDKVEHTYLPHQDPIKTIKEGIINAAPATMEHGITALNYRLPEAPAKKYCAECDTLRSGDVCHKCGENLVVPHARWVEPKLPDIEEIRKYAKALGYVVAVHGTLERDMDLVAMPWSQGAVSAPEFIKNLAIDMEARVIETEDKPGGRYSAELQIKAGGFKNIDISVMGPSKEYHYNGEPAPDGPRLTETSHYIAALAQNRTYIDGVPHLYTPKPVSTSPEYSGQTFLDHAKSIKKLIETLPDAVAHGSEAHRNWLKEAICAHFNGAPIPRKPEGAIYVEVGKQEIVNIDSLFEFLRHGDDAHEEWLCNALHAYFTTMVKPEYVPTDKDKAILDVAELFRQWWFGAIEDSHFFNKAVVLLNVTNGDLYRDPIPKRIFPKNQLALLGWRIDYPNGAEIGAIRFLGADSWKTKERLVAIGAEAVELWGDPDKKPSSGPNPWPTAYNGIPEN